MKDNKKTQISSPEKKFRALISACQVNDSFEVEKLLKSDVNVNEIDSNKRSAIFHCIDHDDLSCLKLLIDAKADLNLKDKDGYSCLHLAVINGNMKILEKLHKSNADINATDGEMHTLVHWAIVCGHANIVDFLLNQKCNAETPDIHGAYPIHYAAQMCGQIDVWDENILRNPQKSLSILKSLIRNKVKIDIEDSDKRTAFIWASSSGSSEAILELFNAGGNPLKHAKDGLTPLHCAASRGHLDCVKVLLDYCKVDIDIIDNNNCTPLFYSVTLGQVEVTEYLIKMKANLSNQDCKGRTIFHCAAAKGQFETLNILCSNDPIVWIPNNRGDFPIHEAYYSRHMDCVYYMLNELKDINVIQTANTVDGRTLLHLAAAENDDAFCEKLLNYGARVNSLMKTSASTYLTPLDVAKLRNSRDCINSIARFGGTTGIKVANIAALKIQRSLKKLVNKAKGTSSPKKIIKQSNDDSKKKQNTNEIKEGPKVASNDKKLIKMNRISKIEQKSPKKKLIDKGAQTNLHLTTHKITAASTGSSNITNLEGYKENNLSSSTESEKSLKSSSGVFAEKSHEPKKTEKKMKQENNSKKVKLKPLQNYTSPSPIKNTKQTGKKLLSERIYNSKTHKRYESEKRASEKIHINKYDRFNSHARDRDEPSFISSNTLSFESSTSLSQSSSLSSLERIHINRLDQSENVHHHHFHCHHYCHHSRKKHRNSDSENEERVKSKVSNNKRSTSRVEMTESNLIENVDETIHNSDNIEEITPNDEHNDELVKLIIKSAEPNDPINLKSHHSLFDRQRLLLKSLYEIRRSRLNNRSIIINADLNNLLLKIYNFDIQKNCKSLKDLERLLEILAVEISDEFRKYNKNSALLKINKPNIMTNRQSNNTSSITALPPANGARSTDSIIGNKQPIKSKSMQLIKSKEEIDFLKQKKNEQLKVAYKPVLPEDIYKQYYDKCSKVTVSKFNSTKDKTIFLPVITKNKNKD